MPYTCCGTRNEWHKRGCPSVQRVATTFFAPCICDHPRYTHSQTGCWTCTCRSYAAQQTSVGVGEPWTDAELDDAHQPEARAEQGAR